MHEVREAVSEWVGEGQPIALATVTRTWGSAPRRPGAKLALTAAGQIAGSVSGGCVESEVVAHGMEVLASGTPRLLHFGVADETAWSVGLACGGELEVFVAPLVEEVFATTDTWLSAELPGAIVTVIDGPDEVAGRQLLVTHQGLVSGSIDPALDAVATAAAQAALRAGRAERIVAESKGGPVTLFVDVIMPPLTLVAVGGGHVTVALTRLANVLGYRTVVVDPRRAFASGERFPHVDRLLATWPVRAFAELNISPATAVVLLSHDPKIDDPPLKHALESDAFYIGALGSRRTHEQRRARLLAAGVAEELLARIHAPVGLNLGAESPEEIALAIMAEIVAVWRTASGE
jgi:xanthine dehydrogenase accessory factor